MFLGNLPVKYNSEGVGAAATDIKQTFVTEESGGGNHPPNPTPPSDVVKSDINTNLTVSPNQTQVIYVIAVALILGLMVYRSLKKERSSQ